MVSEFTHLFESPNGKVTSFEYEVTFIETGGGGSYFLYGDTLFEHVIPVRGDAVAYYPHLPQNGHHTAYKFSNQMFCGYVAETFQIPNERAIFKYGNGFLLQVDFDLMAKLPELLVAYSKKTYSSDTLVRVASTSLPEPYLSDAYKEVLNQSYESSGLGSLDDIIRNSYMLELTVFHPDYSRRPTISTHDYQMFGLSTSQDEDIKLTILGSRYVDAFIPYSSGSGLKLPARVVTLPLQDFRILWRLIDGQIKKHLDYITQSINHKEENNTIIKAVLINNATGERKVLGENQDIRAEAEEAIRNALGQGELVNWVRKELGEDILKKLVAEVPLGDLRFLFNEETRSFTLPTPEVLLDRAINIENFDVSFLVTLLADYLKQHYSSNNLTVHFDLSEEQIHEQSREVSLIYTFKCRLNGLLVARWREYFIGETINGAWVIRKTAADMSASVLALLNAFEEPVPTITAEDRPEPNWEELRQERLRRERRNDTSSLLQTAGEDVREILQTTVHTGRRHGNPPEYWGVEPDGSLTLGGVEIRSPFKPPMTVPAMLESMNRLFEGLSGKGYTADDTCGLHVSFSRKDKSITETDMVKLSVLLGDNYILRSFNREAYTYAASTSNSLNDNIHRSIQRGYLDREDLIAAIQQGDITRIKELINYQFVNHFNSVNIDINPGSTKNRVEFRQMGHDNYINRFDEIRNNVNHFALVFFAATEPNLLRKRYLSRLLSWVRPQEQDPLHLKAEKKKKEKQVESLAENINEDFLRKFFRSQYYTEILQTGFEAEVITP